MLMPSIFSRDFMDDLFDMPQRTYAKSYSANGLMKTDIKESEEEFTVEMDLPGSFYVGDNMKQEDIKAKFENGVLTLQVPKKEEISEEQTKKFITIG